MKSESFPCELVTWNDAYLLAKDLSRKIKYSGFSPDLVIAIGRGGYVPARVVCDFMLHDLLTCMKVEHWGVAAHKKDKAEVRFPLAVDVSGLKVLILDDVTDTGDTLQISVDYVGSLGPEEIRTGVLQHKISSLFRPDYYSEKIVEWRWIIYPWASYEDLVGFSERVLLKGPLTFEKTISELERRFQIEVSGERMGEVLEDLVNLGRVVKNGNLYSLVGD